LRSWKRYFRCAEDVSIKPVEEAWLDSMQVPFLYEYLEGSVRVQNARSCHAAEEN